MSNSQKDLTMLAQAQDAEAFEGLMLTLERDDEAEEVQQAVHILGEKMADDIVAEAAADTEDAEQQAFIGVRALRRAAKTWVAQAFEYKLKSSRETLESANAAFAKDFVDALSWRGTDMIRASFAKEQMQRVLTLMAGDDQTLSQTAGAIRVVRDEMAKALLQRPYEHNSTAALANVIKAEKNIAAKHVLRTCSDALKFMGEDASLPAAVLPY